MPDTRDNIYVHAALGREGLGNLLVPWAKAEVFRRDHGVEMLAPQWTKPKIGPLLRGERDKRFYVGLFDNSGYVRGIRRRLILARSSLVPGEQFDAGRIAGLTVVFYKGCEGGLSGLGKNQGYVRWRLESILSKRVRAALAGTEGSYEIAAHVRRGDRPPMKFGEPFSGSWGPGMPDEWFINCINAAREAAGRSVSVRVFSDAKPGQIDRILSLPDVTLSPPKPSVVDMFLMSRCKVLIATGTSTFSSWASFLGGALTLYYPGLLAGLKPDWPGGSLETDLTGAMTSEAMYAVRAVLKS